MKAILGICAAMGALAWFLGAGAGCAHFKPDPACQGDPATKPCPCMDPRTLGCAAPPMDTVRTDGGTDR